MVSRTIALALLTGLALAPVAEAQSKFTFSPSFRTLAVYDDNLFSTASEPVGSYYLRFTPRIATVYDGSSLAFNAGYSFDAELYPDERSELTDAFARQLATVGFTYRMTRSASLSMDANYRMSNRPSDLVADTGLDLGRRRSESYGAGLSFEKQFSAHNSWDVGYNYNLLEFESSNSSISHSITTAWNHSYWTLTTSTLRYTYRLYEFGDELSALVLDGRSAKSHLVTFGWTRQLSQRTSVTLQLGPRLSEDFVNINASESVELSTDRAVGADALASIQYSKEKTSLSFSYARGENQVFARSGFVDTDSVSLNFGQGAGRSFRFRVSPGAYRNTRGGVETWTYRANVSARAGLTDWLHFVATYRYSFQQGSFVNTPTGILIDEREFSHNVATIGFTLGDSFEQ